MKSSFLSALALLCSLPALAQQAPYQNDPGYQKEMVKADEARQKHRYHEEMDALKNADKKSQHASPDCLNKLIRLQLKIGDFKSAADSAARLESISATPADKASAELWRGVAVLKLNQEKPNQDQLAQADKDLKDALIQSPTLNFAYFIDGSVLALMNQDDAAKAQFAQFVEHAPPSELYRERSIRFAANPALAREKLAPPFSIVTADGTPLSLDSLNGRVVLLDFWATWCGPCKIELPHVKKLAEKYEGKPFVVLSVSIDSDQAKWKDYITAHDMKWLQYNDAKGDVARIFGVHSIPHYFTIDTDGILRSEDVGGGANIDGRIKKLVEDAERSHAAPSTETGSASIASQKDAQTTLANLPAHR